MNDTFLPKREKRKVNHLHTSISMYFSRTVLDTFQTCNLHGEYSLKIKSSFKFVIISLVFYKPNVDSAVNNKLFGTFLNHNLLWTGIKLVAHIIVLTNSSLTWNPDAWLILYSLFSTDALLKLWRHEELRGLYKVTLICIGWQLFDWLIKLKIEIILTVCAGLVVKYAGHWSLIKSIKSKKSQVVCTAPCVP